MNVTIDYLSGLFSPKVADHTKDINLLIKYVKSMETLSSLEANLDADDVCSITLYNDSNIRGLLTSIAFFEQVGRNIEKDKKFSYTVKETISMVMDSLLAEVSPDSFMYNCESFEPAIEEGIALADLHFLEIAERFVDENIKGIKRVNNSNLINSLDVENLIYLYNQYLYECLNIKPQYLTKAVVCIIKTYPFVNALCTYAKKHNLPNNYFTNVIKRFQFFVKKGTVDCDNIFIINGVGGSGKDTFVQNVFNHADTFNLYRVNYSLVDNVKSAAKLLGWNGKKDDKGREFLATLKDIADDYNNYSIRDCLSSIVKVREIKFSYMFSLMFIHARSPKDIRTLVSLIPDIKTILVKRGDYNPKFTNHADNEVYDYDYDEVIVNTTLTSLEAISEEFVSKYGLSMS